MGKHHHDPIEFDESIPGVQKYWDTKQQYLKFETTVQEVEESWVKLDRNLFYPEGGGQPGDTGVLKIDDRILDVIDTQKKEDGVWIRIRGDGLSSGDHVYCEIDENRRLVLSRNHSGQHLLSASFYRLFEADTVRAELRVDESQIDLDKKLDMDEVTKAFDLCVEQIGESLDISTKILKKADLKKYNLRGELAKVGDNGIYRAVQIGDDRDPFDLNLCGGTHVGSTSEILSLSLSKMEAKKVRFTSGVASLEELTRRNAQNLSILRILNTSEDKMITTIRKLLDDQTANGRKINKMNTELLYYKFREMDWIDGKDIRYKILDQIEGDRSQLGRIFDSLGEKEVMISRFSNGVITIASGSEEVSRRVFESLRKLGMKGGGKGKILMGKGKDLEWGDLEI